MADNIYLLETRLSREQQAALDLIREVARGNGLTVFLVGGAVRDLISGTAVRDLDVAIQGDVRTLRGALEAAGAVIEGESDLWQAFYLALPGGVRMEVSSTISVSYPTPGKPVIIQATILDDLRRRDFTANAMALSLNEGSYGLLMDPLNGVADIENRQLRLVSNYGFIEDPALILRAARFMGRLGWTLEEKTQTRYETSREEGYIQALDDFHRGYELEELFHEEDPLRVMRRVEEEGWLTHISPVLGSAKANVAELQRLRDVQAQLQTQGIATNAGALGFPLITAKISASDVQALKGSFPRQGFVREIESLETAGKEFVSQLTGKAAAQPSQSYRLIRSSSPEAVLWAAFYSKNANLQAKFKSFYGEWPQARQRIPYTLLQEMRITPELPGYDDLLEKIFFELMDGRLDTTETMKAFLEPYSPPAPPPPVSLRRARASKKDSKPSRSRKKASAAEPETDADTDDARPVRAEPGDDHDGDDSDDEDLVPDEVPPMGPRDEETRDEEDEDDEPAPPPSPAPKPAKVASRKAAPVAPVEAPPVPAKKAAPVEVSVVPAKKAAPVVKIEPPRPPAKAIAAKSTETTAAQKAGKKAPVPPKPAPKSPTKSVKGTPPPPARAAVVKPAPPKIVAPTKASSAKKPVPSKQTTPPSKSVSARKPVAIPAKKSTAAPVKHGKKLAPPAPAKRKR